MTDYISREAAYPLAKKICDAFYDDKHSAIEMPYLILDWIDDIPAADVRPVVRCKDCRHRDPEDRKCDSGEMERQGCVFPVDDDYFCAYGER